MKYKAIITKKARLQIGKSKNWYNAQSYLRGDDFIQEIKIAIDLWCTWLVDFQTVSEILRRAPIKRFPYHLYYERIETPKQVIIYAVLHERMNPKAIEEI